MRENPFRNLSLARATEKINMNVTPMKSPPQHECVKCFMERAAPNIFKPNHVGKYFFFFFY